MNKWFGKILYAILIVFMTFFIIQSAYDARSNAYLVENMTNEWDNEEKFFTGINTLLNLDYITNEPIIPAYVDNTGSHKLTVQLYGIGYTDSEGNHLDGLMIYVNNLSIYNLDTDTGLLKKVENPYIKLTIYTDEIVDGEPVSYSGFEGQNFAAGFMFDQVSAEVAYDLTKDDGTLANITRIDIDYSDGATVGGELVYKPESLMILSNTAVDDPVFDDSLKITDFSYDPATYRLQNEITSYPVTSEQALALNLFTNRDDLADYNWQMIRIYLIYAAFVVIVTYLVFFHKKTVQYVRDKKAAKKRGLEGDSLVVEAEVSEQIFKEPEEVDKDGK